MKSVLFKLSGAIFSLLLITAVFFASTAYAADAAGAVPFPKRMITYKGTTAPIKAYLASEQASADKFADFSAKLTKSSEALRIYITTENLVNGDNEIGKSGDQIFGRNKIKKFFIGPDKKKIKELQTTLNLGRNRINQLTIIKSQIEKNQTPELATEYSTLIDEITANNSTLTDAIDKESKSFSLFGWAIK
ncbi:MAG: hypothetical protein WCO23_01210 [bacterium]